MSQNKDKHNKYETKFNLSELYSLDDLKKAISSSREDIIKKESEIRNLNSELAKAVSENRKLSKDLDILEGENKDILSSGNSFYRIIKNKEINGENINVNGGILLK